MKKLLLLFASVLLAANAGAQIKKEIAIPDIGGYKTLKCDFHMHTVFSDGQVWPTTRVDEAYREGLDVIAITDHLEVRPWRNDVPGSHNRSYEIARPRADQRGIVLIKGTEITKHVMPPGHFNALFISDADLIDNEDYMVQLREAKRQNAFIFWNHPGWRAQQAETVWWDEHTRIYDEGCMHGIEVFNSDEYYPEAHQWALDRKLTILCNTDAHSPTGMSYDLADGHRPMTLVFAKERTEAGVREALEARRTAAYFDDIVVAEAAYLKEIFENSLEIVGIEKNKGSVKVTLINKSDLPFHIKKIGGAADYKDFTIPAMSKVNITAKLPEGESSPGTTFEIGNLYASPEKGLQYTFNF